MWCMQASVFSEAVFLFSENKVCHLVPLNISHGVRADSCDHVTLWSRSETVPWVCGNWPLCVLIEGREMDQLFPSASGVSLTDSAHHSVSIHLNRLISPLEPS